jgi:tRNA nucleotidyltransferase (CCA-adding enzyme)
MMNVVVKIDTPGLHGALQSVCDVIAGAGGRALLVGGCVRDFALGIPAKDLDVEVYGIEPKRLLEILKERFKVDLVGQAFGVIKIHGHAIDVSIPRRESKAGLGHKGFEICSDPDMSPAEAASRRDFTMNAIAFDPRREEIIDPYNGLRDLEHRLLREFHLEGLRHEGYSVPPPSSYSTYIDVPV